MNIVAIIQARVSSTRLPGKVLMKLGEKSVVENIVDRVNRSKFVDDVVVATSTESSDDEVEKVLNESGIECFRGSLDNVLERFYLCAKSKSADTIIRLTGDNALVAPDIIDEAVKEFQKQVADYLYYKTSLPLGMCVEVFTFSALERAYREAVDTECIEHVTPYIRKNPHIFKAVNYSNLKDIDYSKLRFTMDTRSDYEFVKKIYNHFKTNDFSYLDIIRSLEEHPDWIKINCEVVQNEITYSGEQMALSEKYLKVRIENGVPYF